MPRHIFMGEVSYVLEPVREVFSDESKKIYALSPLILLFSLVSCATTFQPKPERPELAQKFTEFKLDISSIRDDPVFLQIKKDMEGKWSILELLQSYMKELGKDASPESPYLQRLAWLFAKGHPVDLQGHYYGLTLVLKKGEHR